MCVFSLALSLARTVSFFLAALSLQTYKDSCMSSGLYLYLWLVLNVY
jgi:hypothetical protein